MKNIRITFRLSPNQLAQGLQIIRQLDPSYKLISINNLVKTIYHNHISEMTSNKSSNMSSELVEEINKAADISNKKLTLEDLISIK